MEKKQGKECEKKNRHGRCSLRKMCTSVTGKSRDPPRVAEKGFRQNSATLVKRSILRSEESGFLGEGRSAFLEEKANELAAGK